MPHRRYGSKDIRVLRLKRVQCDYADVCARGRFWDLDIDLALSLSEFGRHTVGEQACRNDSRVHTLERAHRRLPSEDVDEEHLIGSRIPSGLVLP